MSDAPRPIRTQILEHTLECVTGSTLGVLTPLLGLVLFWDLSQGRAPSVPFAHDFALVATLCVSVAAIVGAPCGLLGAIAAFGLRRRRHADWPENLAAFCGSYLGGTVTALLSGLFLISR